MGQLVTNKIFSVHFLTDSVSFEEKISKKCNFKNVIGSVGHHLYYINWSSAPYPFYIQTFQENPFTTLGISRHFKINFNWASGSLTTYFPFILSLSALIVKKQKFKKKKFKTINWVSGSPPILYKLVLGPIPILHTNVHENPLTTFGITDILKLFN